jgi:ABC-type multidrug transport system fused ATPase/permease subunit
MQNPPITLLKRLWSKFELHRQRQFFMILGLMLFASFAEIISIGAVLPFLSVLTSPERVFEIPIAQPVIRTLQITDPTQLLLPISLAFGLSAVLAGTARLLLLWASAKFSFAAGADISTSIYRRTLYQSYAVHCSRNSSEIIDSISVKSNGVIYGVIVPTLTLISSVVLLLSILIALLIIDPIVALVAFGGFGFIYLVIIRLTRKQLNIDSKCIARESTQVVKSLQEGLGGIRDVLIDGSQKAYCQIYRNADSALRRAQGNSLFIAASPRYGMEALGMLLIAGIAYSLAEQANGIINAVPILGALALGAQRLLPVLQQAYSSWIQINSGRASLADVIELLDQPLPDYVNKVVGLMPFSRHIVLDRVGFRYEKNSQYILKNLSLTIIKGDRVGFVGRTGSGKSTLLDIIMGLLQPTEGSILIDGQELTVENNRAWQGNIAHVPQVIFLADSTIEENIAFGIPRDQIDYSRVKRAAKQAQISEIIESWPMQYQTYVGERGIRLSGGQRQRIGIARALYKQADVIIFDEATSALDSETEGAVMEAIESLSKELTLLIVAHRFATLKSCNQIVELNKGCIKRVGSYKEMLSD